MKRYWVISPYASEFQEGFEKSWKYDLENGVTAIGWAKLGDVSRLSDEELISRIQTEYPERDPNHIYRTFKCFYQEIKIGDIIIARKGRKTILGVGEVVGGAFYNKEMGKASYSGRGEDRLFSNFIKVKWQEKAIEFEKLVFSMATLYEISEEKYYSLIKGEISEGIDEEIKEQPEFVLEKYLEDFIVANFSKIFKGKLKLYEDEEGNGQQYPTEIGNIDILARELATNSYVVIELKKGRESDKVVGQILRYMGWVKGNLSKGETVKGMIILKDKDERLEYSLKAIPNTDIEVKLYKVDFQLVD